MFSTNEDGNNKLFSLQDYMMKQKRQKSVFSLSKTVKRLFFLDFSTKSFYYKHQASDTDCKTISSFKDIRDVQEFDHPHQDIIRKWPYALKIITNSQVVILFDSIEKVTKWKEALDNIILMNKRLNDYKQLRRSRSQDKFSSQTSQQSNQQNQYQHTMQSQNANHYSQSNVANNFDFSSSRRTQSHSKTYNQQTPSTNMSNQKQSNTLHQQKQSSFQINPYGGNNDQNSKYIPVKNISISNFQQQQYQNQLLLKPQHASRSRQSDIGTKYTKTFIQNSEPFEYQDLNPGLHHQLTFSAEKQLKQYPTHRPLNSVRIDDHHNQHFITNQIDHQINHQQNMMVMNAQTVQEPQILRQSQSSLLQKSFGKYVVDQESMFPNNLSSRYKKNKSSDINLIWTFTIPKIVRNQRTVKTLNNNNRVQIRRQQTLNLIMIDQWMTIFIKGNPAQIPFKKCLLLLKIVKSVEQWRMTLQ
eukprot:403363518